MSVAQQPSDSETRSSWPMAAAAGAFAVVMVGTTLPTPLYGLYRQAWGFSELTVTVVFAVYALGVMTVLTFLGDLSDVVGRRRATLLGLSLAAVSSAIFLAADGLPMLMAGRLCSGFSAGLFTGAATAYVLELAPPGAHDRAAFVATAANMGGLGLGPVLGGLLAQYAPWPLRLPYLVHLLLTLAATAVTWRLPETVTEAKPWRASHVRFPALPRSVRARFVPAGLAGFVGFSLLGLFTSVTPEFLSHGLGVTNLAAIGGVVLTAFAGSTAGQFLAVRFSPERTLPLGCFLLLIGFGLVAVTLTWRSLTVLLLAALVGGAGQGFVLRSSVAQLSSQAGAAKGQVLSAFFLVAYAGISLPVVGVGLLASALGLPTAGRILAAVMGALSLIVGLHLRTPARAGASPEASDRAGAD
ncbi:MFS transporter [Streptacidiphilus monticola]|uniref:MFS transporter n=1 Tax=Streptacidiphilus monticola TaxID=2161674 RepID=A0ABW1GA12_9ACTN